MKVGDDEGEAGERESGGDQDQENNEEGDPDGRETKQSKREFSLEEPEQIKPPTPDPEGEEAQEED